MNTDYSEIEKHLLNDFQHDLPLTPRPFAAIAARLGVSEEEVIETLQDLQSQRVVSRVGPVFAVNTVGASSLAAMAVPERCLEDVAQQVSRYPEVNHNYRRDHRVNLWFVVTAENEDALREVLTDMEQRTGFSVLYLPMLEDYHINLGFDLQWT